MTNPVFMRAVIFVLKHEGGYVNDPDDPGGETKYGISKRSYPNLDIFNLTTGMAKRIYQQDYWDRLRCGEMSPPVGMMVFVTSVNCGRRRSSMWLQESINFFESIKIDGIIGNKTLSSLQRCDAIRLCLTFLYHRFFHYACLGKKYPQYIRGWIGRTSELMREIAWLDVR